MSGAFRYEKKYWSDDSPTEVEACKAEITVNGSQRSCANVAKGRLRPVRGIAADDRICLPRVTNSLVTELSVYGEAAITNPCRIQAHEDRDGKTREEEDQYVEFMTECIEIFGTYTEQKRISRK